MVQALAHHHDDVPAVTLSTLRRDLFAVEPWVITLVAGDSDRLDGYATLVKLARFQNGARGLDLHHLYVHHDRRGLGIGLALVMAAKQRAMVLGCSYMTVSTHPENRTAQAWYVRHGFSVAAGHAPRFAMQV